MTAATDSTVDGAIGQSPKRVEDDRFIRGKGNYVDDVQLPGMLHMAIYRSPFAHAKINSIDTSRAEAMPGVVACVTGDLLAQHGLAWMPTLAGDTQAVLATDKVRFQGQEVAFVIAENRYIAKDALELIDVEYEVLEPVMDARRAIEPGAPILHPRLRTAEPVGAAPAPDSQTNIASHLQMILGDVEAGFGQADIIVEDEFHTGTAHQRHTSLAAPKEKRNAAQRHPRGEVLPARLQGRTARAVPGAARGA